MTGSGDQGNASETVFDQALREVIRSAEIVKARKADVQIVRTALDKDCGNIIIFDPGLKEIAVFRLRCDDEQPGHIVPREIVDLLALDIRRIVGEGYADIVGLILQIGGNTLKDIRVIRIINVRQDNADLARSGRLEAARGGVGDIFQFFYGIHNPALCFRPDIFGSAQTAGDRGDGNAGIFCNIL